MPVKDYKNMNGYWIYRVVDRDGMKILGSFIKREEALAYDKELHGKPEYKPDRLRDHEIEIDARGRIVKTRKAKATLEQQALKKRLDKLNKGEEVDDIDLDKFTHELTQSGILDRAKEELSKD